MLRIKYDTYIYACIHYDECGVNFMFGAARKSLHVAAVQEIAMNLKELYYTV